MAKFMGRVGEMENNAKSQDGGHKYQDGSHKMLSISILMLNKLHVLLHFSTYKVRVNILWFVHNIFSFLD